MSNSTNILDMLLQKRNKITNVFYFLGVALSIFIITTGFMPVSSDEKKSEIITSTCENPFSDAL